MSRRTPSGIAYEVSGSGPAVLLLHEGIADRTMWDPQADRWRDRFTVIRYDHRGFGESPDPEGDFSLHLDALEVLDAAGVDRAAVIGASMGGEAALDLALAAPERVAALVLVVTTPSGWEHPPEHLARFEEIDAVFERDGIGPANELELRMWVDGVGREPSDVDPEVRGRISAINRALIERQGDSEVEPAELDPPAIGRLGEVGAPTLVVTGALDQPSVNAGAAAIADGIAGAERVEIADTAHVPNLERPDEFDRAVVPFLVRHA